MITEKEFIKLSSYCITKNIENGKIKASDIDAITTVMADVINIITTHPEVIDMIRKELEEEQNETES